MRHIVYLNCEIDSNYHYANIVLFYFTVVYFTNVSIEFQYIVYDHFIIIKTPTVFVIFTIAVVTASTIVSIVTTLMRTSL